VNKRIYLSPPHMGGAELELVKKVFESNWIAPVGPDITAFESEICAYTGAENAVALTSGTAAIHLALQLCNVKQGDVVLCSTFTFAGSVFPVKYLGAEPVFIDSESQSWNMDVELLEKAIVELRAEGKTVAAVIAVHLYGQSADIEQIATICSSYDIPLIEDAAESVGGFYGKQHTGTFGRFGVFSFNGNKIMTTSGGGMLVGKQKADIDKARFLSTQARDDFPYYEHTHIGYNYRMSNVLAAIGRGQLQVLEKHISRRQQVFQLYQDFFSTNGLAQMMPIASWGRPNYWLSCIVLKNREQSETLRLSLEAENIESRPLWKPMHLQPVFKGCSAYLSGVAESAFYHGLCLPSGSGLSNEGILRITTIVQKVLSSNA